MRGGHALREARDVEACDFYRVFAFNPYPMWVFDLETLAMLDVNHAAIRHYGYSKDEFLRMTIREIRPEDDLPRLEKHLPKTRDEAVPDLTMWRHRKKDGTLIDVEVSSFRIRFANRPAKLVMITDLTERKRMEGEVRELLGEIAHVQEEELAAIRALQRDVAGRPPDDAVGAVPRLSRREREVLERVARGHTNREIAVELGLSIKSVEAYRARLMEKLGLKNRAELVRYSIERGLLRRDR